jgi:hypothetical protein
LVTPISPTEIKSYLSNELKGHELLLTLDTISTICVRRLDESKLLHLLSIIRLQLYAELKDASKCVVGEAHGFLHIMYLIVNGVQRFLGRLCFIL